MANCFYRSNRTNDVREWGAKCDVVAVQTGTNATWNPSLGTNGAVVVKKTLLDPRPVSTGGQYIAMSQIGGPTLWVTGTGTAQPAVWATRFSAPGGTQTNYKPGDLISFAGSTGHSGNFSQQIAVIVDAVGSSGAIAQWHFLWGGLYDPTNLPDSPMSQDATRSYLQNGGSGATFTPAWSGWTLLNNQITGSAGSSYAVGDTITLNEGGGTNGTVNQSQYPKLVVESLTSGGTGVSAFDWLNYGSFSALPSTTTTLSQTSTMRGASAGPGSGFTISPVSWTQGPFATKIASTATDASDSSMIDVFLVDKAPFPASLAVQYFYYGDDDGGPINAALASESVSSIAASNASSFTLPGGCGTTLPINLPQDTTANFVNPALVGSNFQSTGLYAFANPLGSRSSNGSLGNTPVLNRVLYGGLANTAGGGFRDMLIEALGIPEGYGYYGLAQGGGAPTGYGGPTASPNNIPSSGDAVEIDGGKYLRITNVHVTGGGIGSGNAIFQCGLDESDPTNIIQSAHVGNVIVADSRFDGNSSLSGATNPDVGLRLGNSCHDSVYRALSVFDGTKADVLEYNGNLFSQIHVNSDAANSSTALGAVVWTTNNSHLAGVADYGIYALGNTSLSQTQCDIANFACVHTASNAASGKLNPGQITDTQVKCGSLVSVPSTYYGVELSDGTVNTTVSGTAAAGACNMPASQLIHLDGSIDGTVTLCNNSNATVVACGSASSGFAAGRYYTQPALAYSTVLLDANKLYAVPFVNPSGGAISKLGIQVTATNTATRCELGVYNAIGGAPGTLILDSRAGLGNLDRGIGGVSA